MPSIEPSDTLRPARLWKQMSTEDRHAAAQAFWADAESVERQQEAIGLIARHINFRPKSVQALQPEKKAQYLVSLTNLPDNVALRLLVLHHLNQRRPMMTQFLNHLQIEHDQGLITDEKLTPPKPSKLKAAATELSAKHPAADVQLYFSTLLCQDPETWRELRKLIQGDK